MATTTMKAMREIDWMTERLDRLDEDLAAAIRAAQRTADSDAAVWDTCAEIERETNALRLEIKERELVAYRAAATAKHAWPR